MSFLGFLTGNTQTVDRVVEAGISGLDKLVFTPEEKADYHKKMQELHLEFMRVAANESTAQSISRRMICLPVVYLWLLSIIATVIMSVFGYDTRAVEYSVEQMGMPALAAIGFYVGRHLVRDWGKPPATN